MKGAHMHTILDAQCIEGRVPMRGAEAGATAQVERAGEDRETRKAAGMDGAEQEGGPTVQTGSVALPGGATPKGDVALILIDVIKGFYEEGGEFYHPAYASTLPPIMRLLDAARRAGRLVIHAREGHAPGEPNFELIKLPEHALIGSFHREYAGGIRPLPGEVELRKRRYSAFFGTDLALMLAEYGIKHVVLAGCKTNVCVRATAQDAFAYGLDVIVPVEAVASNRPHLHSASLEDIDRYMGRVVPVDEAVTLLAWLPTDRHEDAAPPCLPQEGDREPGREA